MAVRWRMEETSSMQMKVDDAGEREEADSVGGESQNTERESLTQSQHSFVGKVQSQHCVACEHLRRSSQFYTRLVGCLHLCIYIHLFREKNTVEGGSVLSIYTSICRDIHCFIGSKKYSKTRVLNST